MNELIEFIKSMISMIPVSKDLKFKGLYGFVLDNGKPMTGSPLPKDIRQGQKKMCFMNAFNLAMERDWTYVEGYALKPGLFPMIHAWCLDDEGNVVDPTWDDPEDCLYYGVEFDINYVTCCVLSNGVYGIIDRFEQGFPLLTGEHAEEQWKHGERLTELNRENL